MAEGHGSILVVEDELPVRQTIQWVLEDEGLLVETAANGQEAIDVAAQRKPILVVLDMALPVLNGHGVATRLREMYGREIPPILVVTADGRAEAKARTVGAYGYLQKPFDIDELIAAVQHGLASRREDG
jgi:CheY-like chemotaxis protein